MVIFKEKQILVRRCGKSGTIIAVGGNVNWHRQYGNSIEIPQNLKIGPHDPVIPLLDTNPKKIETLI